MYVHTPYIYMYVYVYMSIMQLFKMTVKKCKWEKEKI